jgi:hypothetical protein
MNDIAELPRSDDFKGIAHRIVIAVVEAVHELKAWSRTLHRHDSRNICNIPTRRLFAEDMKPALEPGSGDFSRNFVCQADD